MTTKLNVRGRWVQVRWFSPLLLALCPLLATGQTPAKVLERPVAEWQDVAGKALTITYRLTTADSLGAVAVVRDQTGRLRKTLTVTSSQHTPGPAPNQVLVVTLAAGSDVPDGQYFIRTLLTAGPGGAEARAVLVQPLTLRKNPTLP